jgi:hypothetical protein
MELLLDERLDAKVVAARCSQWNAEPQAARAYLTKCEAAEIASADREHRLDALRTARVALSLLKPSPEQQKRLYDALDLRVQLTAAGRLAITAELGLAVEVAANGASSPDEVLAEIIAKPFR